MSSNKKSKIKHIVLVVLSITIVLNVIAVVGVYIAYGKVFSRADFTEYNTDYFYSYNEIDNEKYKREALSIQSGKNMLSSFLYGSENTLGLVIISPGHRDFSDIKLPEIMYFVDNGWMVLCYDYTGCYGSEGKDMVGYIQAPADLSAVLDYVENSDRFSGVPVMLFGHSLGAYASSAVLQYEHNITAVVAASGFDDPMEQWGYSVKRSTGVFGSFLSPYAHLFMKIKFGDMAHFSAISGINSVDLPVLILQGTTDEYYGNVSSIYTHKDRIANRNCTIKLMDNERHNGHYDYFLSDNAITYREKTQSDGIDKNTTIDKFLYMEHDNEIMDFINQFYLNALK